MKSCRACNYDLCSTCAGGGGHRFVDFGTGGVGTCHKCSMGGPSTQSGDKYCASCKLCIVCCTTGEHSGSAPVLTCSASTTGGAVVVGSRVRVKPGVDPRYGWGTNVDSSAVGTVTQLMADGDVKVDFPGRSSEWTGVKAEMEVVGGGGGGWCGPGCEESHGNGDICNECSQRYGVHAGHSCPTGGGRGSFGTGGGGGGPNGHTLRPYSGSSVCCPRCDMHGPSSQTGQRECSECRICESCCDNRGCGGGSSSPGGLTDLDRMLRALGGDDY